MLFELLVAVAAAAVAPSRQARAPSHAQMYLSSAGTLEACASMPLASTLEDPATMPGSSPNDSILSGWLVDLWLQLWLSENRLVIIFEFPAQCCTKLLIGAI